VKDPFDDGRPRVLDDKQTKALQRWLDKAAPLVGLAGWDIRASPFAPEPKSYASSYIRDQADIVFVAVCGELPTWPEPEQRAVLGHELMHPHFQRVTRLAEKLVENELGKRTEAVIETAVSELTEQTVDRLGRAVSRFLPPMDWTD
jgi:hypothetical protein